MANRLCRSNIVLQPRKEGYRQWIANTYITYNIHGFPVTHHMANCYNGHIEKFHPGDDTERKINESGMLLAVGRTRLRLC